MQKVKHIDNPPDIKSLIESHRMTVKYKGFSVTTVILINGYFEANEEPQTLDNLRRYTDSVSLTVVRVGEKIVFRKKMRPLENTTEILRASGDVICDVCEFAYRDHPQDLPPNDFLNVLCNGRRVKL